VTEEVAESNSEKDVEGPIRPVPISRGMACCVLFFAFVYIIPPSIGFLHETLNFKFGFLGLKHPDLFFECVKTIGIHQFGVLCAFVVVFLIIEIFKNIRAKKYTYTGP
jgi:hypothetical protein